MARLPKISIIVPTYNSSLFLDDCLKSIIEQDYPKEKIQLILIDGGSCDNTLNIAKRYTNQIFNNPDRVEERGRAIGIKCSECEIIGFIDADNILPSKDWLKRIIQPFKEADIIGSEPLFYSFTTTDNYITRYCGLIGGDDPISIYLGKFDRYCYFKNKWTESPIEEINRNEYKKIILNISDLPPMGANGFFVRKDALDKIVYDPFLHTDIIFNLVKIGDNCFAKVNIGIIHRQNGSFNNFIRKKARRINRLLTNETVREYQYSLDKIKVAKLIISVMIIIPLLIDSIKGYKEKKDIAWFFHPFICWLVLGTYSILFLKFRLHQVIRYYE